MLKYTVRLIKQALDEQGVPNEIIDEQGSLLRYQSKDGVWHITRSSLSDKIPATALSVAQHKVLAAEVAKHIGLPTLPQYFGSDQTTQESFLKNHAPVVVKPLDSSHGRGVTIGISSVEQLRAAYERAQKYSRQCVLQQQAVGDDYRVLIVDYAVVAITLREHASVVGDGVSTLRELIEAENSTRQNDDNNGPGQIDYQAAQIYLGDRLDSEVPDTAAKVQVVGVANISAGGRAIDKTDDAPAHIAEDAIRLARYLNMPVCGLDCMVNPQTGEYRFIELNAMPNLGMHIFPHIGKSRPVLDIFVEWLLR